MKFLLYSLILVLNVNCLSLQAMMHFADLQEDKNLSLFEAFCNGKLELITKVEIHIDEVGNEHPQQLIKFVKFPHFYSALFKEPIFYEYAIDKAFKILDKTQKYTRSLEERTWYEMPNHPQRTERYLMAFHNFIIREDLPESFKLLKDRKDPLQHEWNNQIVGIKDTMIRKYAEFLTKNDIEQVDTIIKFCETKAKKRNKESQDVYDKILRRVKHNRKKLCSAFMAKDADKIEQAIKKPVQLITYVNNHQK